MPTSHKQVSSRENVTAGQIYNVTRKSTPVVEMSPVTALIIRLPQLREKRGSLTRGKTRDTLRNLRHPHTFYPPDAMLARYML